MSKKEILVAFLGALITFPFLYVLLVLLMSLDDILGL